MNSILKFKLFNTLSNKVETIIPKKPGELKFYACGPTVYSYAHIGNFRSFLTADLIVRSAKMCGFNVTYICNITDVGHLSEDDIADSHGEDKMIKALQREGEKFNNIWDLARFYTNELLIDWKRMGLLEPNIRPRATEHIAEQLELIDKLYKKGFAYETSQGVYFNISKFAKYGILSGNTLNQVRDLTRALVIDTEKQNQQDFALWKKDNTHLMRWHSPYGWGYPGWHIECSAMAMSYFGNSFDIHSGGEDNKFPHHECEIAQSEAASGDAYVSYWVHTAHLLVEGKKMSKRSGNYFTVRDIFKKNIDPLALRYALTCAKYRDQINFTDAALNSAVRVRNRIKNCYEEVIKKIGFDVKINDQTQQFPDFLFAIWHDCFDAMADDLNTPAAYASIIKGIKLINSKLLHMSNDDLLKCRYWFDQINLLTGLIYLEENEFSFDKKNIYNKLTNDEILNRIDMRNEAKKMKDYILADEIRKNLLLLGVELIDTQGGTEWKIVNV